ncbi:aminoglycoside phosphotransferase [Halothermothrix orenii H 168]|uniref:Aminoglycoside phosphotransferase n=1 Tax=Halothermothrix orenii (strain H 168 / OCM 544 / DSM 9562) TaxID=373903 RepID=B8CXT6_HALOH|nr:aminoglycoside phosphotransferase [Halothermothrix orenii H 168]
MSNAEIKDKNYKKLKRNAQNIILKYLGEKREIDGVYNNNWVFLTTDNKKPYMVKFVPQNEARRLEIENTMYKFITSKTDIPVPEVLTYGQNQHGSYLLREVIEGHSLKEYFKKTRNVENIFYEAGQILAKLHSIEFEDKGIIKPDLSVKKYDIFSKTEYLFFLEKLFVNGVISREKYSLLKKVDINYYFGGRKNVLCHCDYTPNNILVKNNQIVGIIDFEWASSAPFMDDLVSFDLFAELDGFNRQINSYYKGYKLIKEIDKFYFENINFYKFYRLITMLSYQVGVTDERYDYQFYNKMRKRFKDIIANCQF